MLLVALACAVPCHAADVFGNSSMGGLSTFVSCHDTGGTFIQGTDSGEDGQWTMHLPRAGTYTAIIEEAFGLGPAIRPGLTITNKGLNRINIGLPLECNLIGGGQPSPTAHEEYGQLIRATGTSMTAIQFRNAEGVQVDVYECTNRARRGESPKYDAAHLGRQIGKALSASSFFPHGALPTVPGVGYYLRFTRADGQPFVMDVVPNSLRDGKARLDGRQDQTVDLAIRVQYDPSGQILRARPGLCQVLGTANQSYGQVFTAKGTSLAMFDVFPAYGDKEYVEPTVRILEGGPGGAQVGPTIKSHIMAFNPGQVPLVRGRKYCIEVTGGAAPGELRMYTEAGNLDGDAMHIDGQAVPDRRLAMSLIEYEPDKAGPAPPVMVQRAPADGTLKLIWDVPSDSDAVKLIIRRIPLPRDDESLEGEQVFEMPVTGQGRYVWVDKGLKNGICYRYSAHTVDISGNESVIERYSTAGGEGTPCAGLPMVVEPMNGGFEAPSDYGIPFGWKALRLAGESPSPKVDNQGKSPDPGNTAGWNSNGKGDFAFYQRVPCEKGKRYKVYADTWRTAPWKNENYNVSTLVGVDPLGRDDPLARSVIWSQPLYAFDRWAIQSVSVTAESDSVTIYLRGYVQYNASREAAVRFDNVRMEDVTDGW